MGSLQNKRSPPCGKTWDIKIKMNRPSFPFMISNGSESQCHPVGIFHISGDSGIVWSKVPQWVGDFQLGPRSWVIAYVIFWSPIFQRSRFACSILMSPFVGRFQVEESSRSKPYLCSSISHMYVITRCVSVRSKADSRRTYPFRWKRSMSS